MLPRTARPKLPTQREIDKERTRDLVRVTARRLFQAHGYEGVGHRDIAAAMGMSTGAVFNSYPGKAAIWRDCMGIEPPNTRDWLEAIALLEYIIAHPETVFAPVLERASLILARVAPS